MPRRGILQILKFATRDFSPKPIPLSHLHISPRAIYIAVAPTVQGVGLYAILEVVTLPYNVPGPRMV